MAVYVGVETGRPLNRSNTRSGNCHALARAFPGLIQARAFAYLRTLHRVLLFCLSELQSCRRPFDLDCLIA